MKQVVTISGIRPDFIRMSHVFRALDNAPGIEHVMIHTGQHYDEMLSGVFFNELTIRKPDYNLAAGHVGNRGSAATTYKILSGIQSLVEQNKIKPDLFLFLGDSNSVACSVELKKQGYKIGHIEAGMRSYDGRMLEETNRIVCDHCSDILFVYHSNYAEKLEQERITNNVFIVGNTILEPAIETIIKHGILPPHMLTPYPERIENVNKVPGPVYVDIHRPENFMDKKRMVQILSFCKYVKDKYAMTDIRWMQFPRTMKRLNDWNIDIAEWGITPWPMMSYVDFLKAQAEAKFLISDSGTAQEEAALVNCPVIVPRDYTERPESVEAECSMMLDLGISVVGGVVKTLSRQAEQANWERACSFAENAKPLAGSRWLYYSPHHTPSKLILNYIKGFLHVE